MGVINTDKILKEIKKGQWYVVGAAPCVPFSCYPWITANTRLKNIGQGNKIVMFLVSRDFGHQVLRKKESLDLSKKLFDDMLHRPSRIKRLLKKWEQDKKRLITAMKGLGRVNFNKTETKSLWRVFENFFKQLIKFWVLCISTDSFHIFNQRYLENLATSQKKISTGEFQELAQELSLSDKKPFLKQQREELYKIILKYYPRLKNEKTFKNTPADFQNKLRRHTQNYFWLQNNFKRAKVLKVKDFWQEVLDILKTKSKKEIGDEVKKIENDERQIKAKKESIIKKLNLDKENKAFFRLTSLWSYIQDEKKHFNLISDHYIFSFAKEFAKRLKIPQYKFCYLSLEEIKEALLGGKQVKMKRIQKRIDQGVFIATFTEAKWVPSGVAKQIWQLLFPPQTIQELKGIVASKGRVTEVKGLVQIVLDPEKVKFKKGNILVTSMTRPDFVPILRRAKAIITNEGGLTSHAAIVSRELGIPCIIGTKVATQVLKDGDRVELDLNKGVARLIKTKNKK